jgi:hypothetical protein
VPRHAVRAVGYLVGGERVRRPRRWPGPGPGRRRRTLDVLACWRKSGPVRCDPRASSNAWSRCSRGSYSIAPPRSVSPSQLHLTVDAVRYDIAGRRRLAWPPRSWQTGRNPGSPSRSYSRRRTGSRLPDERRHTHHHGRDRAPAWPVPLVPVHRKAAKAKGRAGCSSATSARPTDFFYRDELEASSPHGALTRLSTPWSREVERGRSTCRTACARPAGAVGLAQGRRALLLVRRRQAHGQGRGDTRWSRSPPGPVPDERSRPPATSSPMLKATGRYQADVVLMGRVGAMSEPQRSLPPWGRTRVWGKPSPSGQWFPPTPKPSPQGGGGTPRVPTPGCANDMPVLRRSAAGCWRSRRLTAAAIAGDPEAPGEFGRLCSKGSALGRRWGWRRGCCTRSSTVGVRLWARRSIMWAARLLQSGAEHGPRPIAFYSLGPAADGGLLRRQQAGKGFIGTPHVDTNSRLCMASSVGRSPPRLRRRRGAPVLRRT